MQENVDKAMERIAASRPTKPDNYGVPNEDSDDTSMQKHIVSFDAFDTTSRLWSYYRFSKNLFKGMVLDGHMNMYTTFGWFASCTCMIGWY